MNKKETDEYMKLRRRTLDIAALRFAFLTDYGLELTKSELGESISFKDGWEIIFSSKLISVKIAYYDMELIITITKGKIDAPYLLLDFYFYDNQSGFQGVMFPLDKLENAINRISEDIRINYCDILSVEKSIWDRIELIVKDQKQKMKREGKRITLEYSNPLAREKADEAFRNKDYDLVVKLLTPLIENLSDSYKSKLEYSRKHSKGNI
jgi:hypothetical protein